MHAGSFKAMGSTISWWAERDAGSSIAELFEEVEMCCSRFRAGSELERVGRDPRLTVEISPLLARLLAAADAAWRLSEGLVDPTVAAAVAAAGYDDDLERASKIPGAPQPVTGWDSVTLSDSTLTRPAGTRLDLGGSAKGWTAAAALELPGVRLVDAAGDIALRGVWTISVEHAGEKVADLCVEDGGVATSGIDRRRWRGGHHLIDPRTGAPVETDAVAATIVADDLLTAETVAKTVVLMGVWTGLGWAESLPAVRAALVTTTDGPTVALPRSKEVLA
jgi:thiamine biosynthesis lipoprotein